MLKKFRNRPRIVRGRMHNTERKKTADLKRNVDILNAIIVLSKHLFNAKVAQQRNIHVRN